MYAKDPYEDKYQYLINKRECVGINHLNDPKVFIECSNDMHNVYKNIDNYNLDKLNSKVTELFIRGRKLNKSLVLLVNHILKFLRTLEIIARTFLL